MLGKYILKNKVPIRCDDIHKWGKWMETADRHVVDCKKGNIRVSTVFLGLDHRYSGQGKPILFETMVFGGKLDMEQERYYT